MAHAFYKSAPMPQTEADRLLAAKKRYVESQSYAIPKNGTKIEILLVSDDNEYEFLLSIHSSQSYETKYSFQLRTKDTAVVLVRIDIDGPPHINPDGKNLGRNHMHLYTEGKDNENIALPIPDCFGKDYKNIPVMLDHFFDYCNVEIKPVFDRTLFDNGND